jgi:hypothetical protein
VETSLNWLSKPVNVTSIPVGSISGLTKTPSLGAPAGAGGQDRLVRVDHAKQDGHFRTCSVSALPCVVLHLAERQGAAVAGLGRQVAYRRGAVVAMGGV